MVVADLDMGLITKRKRMMDSVGHYARPELLSLAINDRPAATVSAMSEFPLPLYRSPDHASQRDDVGLEPAVDD